jgi:hypothetical protein
VCDATFKPRGTPAEATFPPCLLSPPPAGGRKQIDCRRD